MIKLFFLYIVVLIVFCGNFLSMIYNTDKEYREKVMDQLQNLQDADMNQR